jgi:hypothetical protein
MAKSIELEEGGAPVISHYNNIQRESGHHFEKTSASSQIITTQNI